MSLSIFREKVVSKSFAFHLIRATLAGADSGIAISPGTLPPLAGKPTAAPTSTASKDETEISFGSPLAEIPIDQLKSFYRSEIQYVNFT